MPHIVKCKYCGERFDRDTEPTVQVSERRYAHKKCAEEYENNRTQDEKDFEALEKYIKKLFGEPYVNQKIKNQIRGYHREYQYTYSGMLKSLMYWFEVKGNSIEKSNGGIGILPYIYDQACQYYYSLFLAQLINQNKNIQEYKPKIQTVTIPIPSVPKKPVKLFFKGDNDNV